MLNPTPEDKGKAVALGLAKRCERCDGNGMCDWNDYRGHQKIYCPDCGAQGVVLSDLGKLVGALIERYLHR